MAELDITNPLAVVVAFFGIMLTALLVIFKFAIFGFFGIFLGVGLFTKMMWEK